MTEAVIFSDAHANAADSAGISRLVDFLSTTCAKARRVYILGDFFDFWVGSKQAAVKPYSTLLAGLTALSRAGVAVTFFHGNRDFYVDDALALRCGFRLVPDYSIEDICGSRVLLCHGDMLCTNDVRYHRMRAALRHPATRAVLTRLPLGLALPLAGAFRRRSSLEVASKSRWVLGINETSVLEYFAKGAGVIVSGHTHAQGTRTFETAEGPRRLYTLGDFGLDGSYLECGAEAFTFRNA